MDVNKATFTMELKRRETIGQRHFPGERNTTYRLMSAFSQYRSV
jgi:hypothetical protein